MREPLDIGGVPVLDLGTDYTGVFTVENSSSSTVPFLYVVILPYNFLILKGNYRHFKANTH